MNECSIDKTLLGTFIFYFATSVISVVIATLEHLETILHLSHMSLKTIFNILVLFSRIAA